MPKEAKNKKEKKHFFKDFKAELKRVIWPTPKQLVNNTVAVITIVLITAVIVFVLDFTFKKMNTYGINKLKTMVDSKNETLNEMIEDNTNEGIEENTETQNNNENEAESSEEVSQ